MTRYGSVIGVKPEQLYHYKKLHAAVWPGVLERMKHFHIRNYSIFLRKLPDGQYYLFSYLEYIGTDFAADMATLSADALSQEWSKACDPCHQPLPDRAPDEWWAAMEEVFHCD